MEALPPRTVKEDKLYIGCPFGICKGESAKRGVLEEKRVYGNGNGKRLRKLYGGGDGEGAAGFKEIGKGNALGKGDKVW